MKDCEYYIFLSNKLKPLFFFFKKEMQFTLPSLISSIIIVLHEITENYFLQNHLFLIDG